MNSPTFLKTIVEQIQGIAPAKIIGSVIRTEGMTIAAQGFAAPIGAIARIGSRRVATITGGSDWISR